MPRPLWILCPLLLVSAGFACAQAVVRVQPPKLQGSVALPQQTERAAVRDYLQSWQSLSAALEQNSADLLDADFVGNAKDKLARTIQEQKALGIRTRYQDRAHDLQIVFYSSDGLSVELRDRAEYDLLVLDHDKVKTTRHVSTCYMVVLTPSELRWRVRVFQAVHE